MPTLNAFKARAKRMSQLDVDCLDGIKRQLNKYRFDPAYRGKAKRVPLVQFAHYCAVSRQTLYDLVRGDRKGLEPTTRDRILAAIALVEQHGMRFERVVVQKPVIERRLITPGINEWRAVMPNGEAAPPMPQRHRSEKVIAGYAAGGERLKRAAKLRRTVTVVGP